MKTKTCLSALILLLGGACAPGRATWSADGAGGAQARLRRRAGKALQAGIAAYNDGRIDGAREHLESVLSETEQSPLGYIRAAAHFYLAAVAWDLGEADKTTHHLERCRRSDPAYEPNWIFISPSLRERFDDLR